MFIPAVPFNQRVQISKAVSLYGLYPIRFGRPANRKALGQGVFTRPGPTAVVSIPDAERASRNFPVRVVGGGRIRRFCRGLL